MAVSKYDKYVVAKPAYEVTPKFEVKGRIPAMTLMSGNLVPDAKMYIEAGWVLGMPDPNPHIGEHTHDYDEIIVHFGSDPTNPEDLGGEIEFWLGEEPNIITKSCVIFVPKGVPHCPLILRKVARPISHSATATDKDYRGPHEMD